MEVSTLVILVLSVVFLLIMLTVYIMVFQQSGISGDDSICNRTFGFLRGCS